MGFPPDGEERPEVLPHLGFFILQVSKDHGSPGRFDAGRLQPLGQPFGAEGALFHHPDLPGGITGILFFDVRAGIFPVETPGAIGAAGHAKAAADAAVHVHHDDAVLPLEGGLGGTHPDAGGILAMVAQDQKVHVLQLFRKVRLLLPGKSVMEVLGPDPLDLVAVGHRRGQVSACHPGD